MKTRVVNCTAVSPSLLRPFVFYQATVSIRWARAEGLDLSSPLFVFVRFFFGSLIVAASLMAKRQAVIPQQTRFLIGRAVFNVSAVLCFFKAIQMTTAAEGNILNMTYPIFAAIISWLVFKEQRDRIAVAMAFVAFCGMLMMLLSSESSLGGFRIQLNSLWGLASGIPAAISIVYPNPARRQDYFLRIVCSKAAKLTSINTSSELQRRNVYGNTTFRTRSGQTG